MSQDVICPHFWCYTKCVGKRAKHIHKEVRLFQHYLNQKHIQMPKLADLLCQSVNNSNDFGSDWYIRFAYNLQMDIDKAQKLFDAYGLGYIYSHTGFVMPDTPYQRRKMVVNFGACVIVTSNGDMWLRTPEQIGAKNRKRALKLNTIVYHQVQKEKMEARELKVTQRIFEDGQENPCPKRGGKANSHSDIGKYINCPNASLSAFEPKSIDRFVVINVKIR